MQLSINQTLKQGTNEKYHPLLSQNLRCSIYNVIKFEHTKYTKDSVELFSKKVEVDCEVLWDFLNASKPFFDDEDFVKVYNYLSPPYSLGLLWLRRYTTIE